MNLWCITIIRSKLLDFTWWRIRFLPVVGCFTSSHWVRKNAWFKSHTNIIFKCDKMALGHQTASCCFVQQSSNIPCSCKQTWSRLPLPLHPPIFRRPCLWRCVLCCYKGKDGIQNIVDGVSSLVHAKHKRYKGISPPPSQYIPFPLLKSQPSSTIFSWFFHSALDHILWNTVFIGKGVLSPH